MKKKLARRRRTASALTPRSHEALYQSVAIITISVLTAFIIYQVGFFHEVVRSLDGFGYVGAFVAGMFFVSVFTAAPAGVVLLTLTESMPIVGVSIVAGLGAVMGDLIILSIFKQQAHHVAPFVEEDRGIRKVIKTLRHTKYRLVLTLLGAFVVASPLPDELGLALMGLSRVNPTTTIFLTFVLNTIGIFLLLTTLR